MDASHRVLSSLCTLSRSLSPDRPDLARIPRCRTRSNNAVRPINKAFGVDELMMAERTAFFAGVKEVTNMSRVFSRSNGIGGTWAQYFYFYFNAEVGSNLTLLKFV